MLIPFETSRESRARIDGIRARLDHPVVDGDGHLLESVPMLFDTLHRVAGEKAVEGLRRVLPDLFTGAGSIEG